MTRIVFAIPGDLNTLTGGYGYDRRVIQALPECGVEVVYCPLKGDFPAPHAADIAAALEAIRLCLHAGDVVLIDGLAYGVLPEDAIAAIGAPVLALCHHPLGRETGLPPARREELLKSERAALALAAHVIVTSSHTRNLLMRDFQVPEERMSVALPGTDPAAKAIGSQGALALLAVGSIIPRKGFDILVEALAGLKDCAWHLRIAGSTARAPETAVALARLIATYGLGGRIACVGELPPDELATLFHTSGLFVSSSLYEGYGMALAEAMSHGLPIVSTTGGAAAETVPDEAALKVSPSDAGELRNALRKLITNQNLRARFAATSWQAGQNLPTWQDTALMIVKAAAKFSAGPASHGGI